MWCGACSLCVTSSSLSLVDTPFSFAFAPLIKDLQRPENKTIMSSSSSSSSSSHLRPDYYIDSDGAIVVDSDDDVLPAGEVDKGKPPALEDLSTEALMAAIIAAAKASFEPMSDDTDDETSSASSPASTAAASQTMMPPPPPPARLDAATQTDDDTMPPSSFGLSTTSDKSTMTVKLEDDLDEMEERLSAQQLSDLDKLFLSWKSTTA